MGNWMTATDQQDPKKTGGGDEGIAHQFEALDIKDQAGAAQDNPTTGQEVAGGVARRVQDYCDKAVTNLKAKSVFRFEQAYVYANEALELDGKDTKAAAIRRYALYALDPEKRLLDKALALCEEADQAGDYDKALGLLSMAKLWHCTPGILSLRANLNCGRKRFDLAYLDVAEALAAGFNDNGLVELKKSCLHSLGFKVPPVIESQQRVDELPAHSPLINQPKGLRVESLMVYLEGGYANTFRCLSTVPLMPSIPLDELASFINEQVQGAVKLLSIDGGDGHEDAMLRLLDEVTVPGRLHVDELILADFFHLHWAGIERILDGRTLRTVALHFLRLQLPSGVDPNELLKLPTVRDCSSLALQLYDGNTLPALPDLPPLFKNAALVEWVTLDANQRRTLWLTREYLSSGLLGFLDALKKDFQLATQAHSYCVMVLCPNFDVADGLRDEHLSNRLGEGMTISVGEDPQATVLMGHRFEAVKVERLPQT